MHKTDEHIQSLLKQVFDTCQKEDTGVRERQIRQWRRLKLLWEGFQRVWFSEVAHDWRVWDETQGEDTDQAYYDKPINVLKAYLESIIAALSVLVPPIKCYPDDADNTLDLTTAKAGDKISQLIYRHNDVPLLWLHALFIYQTEGMTAFYNYTDENESYGTYEEKEFDDIQEEHDIATCPNCGNIIDDKVSNSPEQIPTDENKLEGQPTIQLGMQGQSLNQQPLNQQPKINPITGPEPNLNDSGQDNLGQDNSNSNELNSNQNSDESNRNQNQNLTDDYLDEFQPDNEDAKLHAMMYEGQDLCPACMMMVNPELSKEKFIVTRLIGITNKPKSRQCIEVYGGLYVKVGNYAKKQKDAPYLILSYEKDYSLIVEKYKHLHGNENLLESLKSGSNAGGYNQYDQWGRLSPQYQGEYPINTITINNAWIRSARFNVLNDEDDIALLKKEYPDGVKVVFANDEFAEACNESLDDHWTLTENPMSDYLHFEPPAQGLVSVQEITNDLISLTLQTIEHGIGQTFADPAVLDFNAYEQTEALPGGVFPATPKSGRTLNEGFHELRTATLSSEVMPFAQQIQSLGQVASGALPSIFGGQLEGAGGDTASGYSMARAQALQRLQNTWKLFITTWKQLFSKVIPQYIKDVKDDERDVQRDTNGNFINVFIRRAELEGKIGKVELEANENLPMTWSQRKDLLMNLLTASNPKILEIINAPENVGLLHDALGLVDFYVPGEDDIIKQYDEITMLLNSEPIPNPGDPNMPELPSVDIDVLYDNHPTEFEIVRKWVISEVGRQAKTDNELGYRNVLLHGKLHFMQVQAMQQQQMASSEGGAPSTEKPNPKKREAPIMGENDVKTA